MYNKFQDKNRTPSCALPGHAWRGHYSAHPLPLSLSLSILPHTGHILILSAVVLSLLSGLVQALPHTPTCLAPAYHSVSAQCLRDAFLNPQSLHSKDLGGIFW